MAVVDDLKAQLLAEGEHSNADLIGAVIFRLRKLGPSREKSLAITKLHEALMWLSAEAETLP